MKKIALATVALAALASQAQALEVEMFGQVNKAVMVYDDKKDTEFNVVDNNLSVTNIGWAAEQKLDNGYTASVLFDVDLSSNNSATLTQNTTTGSQSTALSTVDNFSESNARVGIANDYFALFIGQQATAIDDAFYHDLAAAGDVMGPGFSAFGSGLVFRDPTTGAAVTLGGANATVNALSFGWNGNLEQQDSVRLDTLTWNGFNASISTSQGGDVDMNVRYANKFDTFEVDGALGYALENSGTAGADTAERTINASFSAKHESGLAGTVAYFEQDLERKTAGNDDPSGYYVKLGYNWDAFGIAIDMASVSDAVTAATTEHELKSYGIGGQYDMGNGVSLGATARTYEADITGTDTDDISVYALNMRVKF